MNQSPRLPIRLEQPGQFSIGCNYWASHAGTAMWRDWRPDVVRQDLERLAAQGVGVMRVFPLWPDFQPITMLYGGGGTAVEVRHDETPLEDAEAAGHGVSAVMLARFSEFCRIAADCKIELIVGLVTGWMSGRLFVPPALAGRNVITDPLSITWQIRMVRAIVRHAAGESAIVAWDLGNECNCMAAAGSAEAAYVWTASISNAIRAADPSRPVVSGMHSLTSSAGRVDGQRNPWSIEDQGELTDLLTTHPYPYWSRHTRADRVDSLRTTMHATAETRYYADVGGKPCFAEEIGTMGPMVASDSASADFARVNLFSLWANDCRGFLWWCASDQHGLAHAPYDWVGVELELGLLRNDGTAKPVLHEMGKFRKLLDRLPFKELPRRATDAVCLLTHDVDDWAAAYGTFVLAKQAGLEVDFRQIQQPIPERAIYLLPSIKGPGAIPRRKWNDLIARVRRGATLYLSLDDGIVSHFNEIAGVEVLARHLGRGPVEVKLADGGAVLPVPAGERMIVRNVDADVLGTHPDTGAPLFWRHRLGAGTVIVLAAPLETGLASVPGAFDTEAAPYWNVYAELLRHRPGKRLIRPANPNVALTEHVLPDGQYVVIAINHSAERQTVRLEAARATLGQVFHGVATLASGHATIDVAPFDACVFILQF